MKRVLLWTLCFLFVFVVSVATGLAAEKPVEKKKILYYDYTYRFVHTPTIDKNGEPGVCAAVIKKIAAKYHCEVVCTKDGSIFDKDLSSYAAFVFYTSGELNHPGGKVGAPLSDKGRKNFQDAIQKGTGFLGIHSATVHPLKKNNPDELGVAYVKMIGANLIGHGKSQEATVIATDPMELPCLKKYGKTFRHFEEWYAMKNFNKDIHVLLVLKTEGMVGKLYKPALFPVAWARMEGKGRVAYHALGHEIKHWSQELVLDLTDDLLRFVLGDLNLDLTPNLEKICPVSEYVKEF